MNVNRPDIEFFWEVWINKFVFRAPKSEVLMAKANELIRERWILSDFEHHTTIAEVGNFLVLDEFYEFHATEPKIDGPPDFYY